MKNKLWKLSIFIGSAMILCSGALFMQNMKDSKRAGERSRTVLVSLKEQIPSDTALKCETAPAYEKNDLFYEYSTQPAETSGNADIIIDDIAYYGYISIPTLDIELPVMSSWNYNSLNISPCRYSGSLETHDLIIAAHNYNTHFGRINSLEPDDMIIFTDTSGKQYDFSVTSVEQVNGKDTSSMLSGAQNEWELTLFTCTLSGKSRFTIRASATH